MLFIVASIAFFSISIRSTLLWTYIWQKNQYSLTSIAASIKKLPRKKLMRYVFLDVLFLLLIILYGTIVFFDGYSFLYQIAITLLFTISAITFFTEFLKLTFKRPSFSLKALSVSLVTTFFISFFYTIPLTDTFLWLIILYLSTPIIVAIFVGLLAFPSEVYEDYIFQKVKEKINQNEGIFSIAIIGKNTDSIKNTLNNILGNTFHCLVIKECDFLSFLAVMKKKITNAPILCIFSLPEKKEEIEKLSQIVFPDVFIITSDIKNKDIYKFLLRTILRESTNISSIHNTSLNAFLKKNGKKVLLYGLQKSSTRKGLAIFAYDQKIHSEKMTSMIHIEKEDHRFVGLPFSPNELLHTLPSVFVARKLGISFRKIEANLKTIS